MNLPDLAVQSGYARVAWAVVLATLVMWALTSATARFRRTGAPARIGAIVLSLALMFLPGEWSPAYWLGLVFHLPSLMLVALCLVRMCLRRADLNASPALTPRLSWLVVLGGALLYADTFGVLSLQIYALGFDPWMAPIAALGLGAWAFYRLRHAMAPGWGLALLISVLGYCLLRLPSGNLFDAVLDPILWIAALWSVLRDLLHRLRASAGARPTAAAATRDV